MFLALRIHLCKLITDFGFFTIVRDFNFDDKADYTLFHGIAEVYWNTLDSPYVFLLYNLSSLNVHVLPEMTAGDGAELTAA